jgi:hypothetical protein
MFHAATSAIAVATMTNIARGLRGQGHTVGERFLPAFRMEKEPADKVMVLLSPNQASQYQNVGAELAVTFGFFGNNDDDVAILVELPNDDQDLVENFDIDSVISKLEGEKPGKLGFEQAKAEAIERGLEVTADTTREQLEHMLGIDISSGIQADDRKTDEANNQNLGEQRIGLRTSNILPSVNGLDLVRMNDEQLRSAAAQLGLKVTANMKRDTIIGAIQKSFAKKVNAPEDAGAKTPTAATDPGSDKLPSSETEAPSLDGLDADALKIIAEKEGVDIGRMTSADSIRKAIEAKREEVKAHG